VRALAAPGSPLPRARSDAGIFTQFILLSGHGCCAHLYFSLFVRSVAGGLCRGADGRMAHNHTRAQSSRPSTGRPPMHFMPWSPASCLTANGPIVPFRRGSRFSGGSLYYFSRRHLLPGTTAEQGSSFSGGRSARSFALSLVLRCQALYPHRAGCWLYSLSSPVVSAWQGQSFRVDARPMSYRHRLQLHFPWSNPCWIAFLGQWAFGLPNQTHGIN